MPAKEAGIKTELSWKQSKASRNFS